MKAHEAPLHVLCKVKFDSCEKTEQYDPRSYEDTCQCEGLDTCGKYPYSHSVITAASTHIYSTANQVEYGIKTTQIALASTTYLKCHFWKSLEKKIKLRELKKSLLDWKKNLQGCCIFKTFKSCTDELTSLRCTHHTACHTTNWYYSNWHIFWLKTLLNSSHPADMEWANGPVVKQAQGDLRRWTGLTCRWQKISTLSTSVWACRHAEY